MPHSHVYKVVLPLCSQKHSYSTIVHALCLFLAAITIQQVMSLEISPNLCVGDSDYNFHYAIVSHKIQLIFHFVSFNLGRQLIYLEY